MSKNLKEKIYQTSKELFYELGYEKTTIAKIAKSCNTSKGVVSHHYRTKSILASEIDGEYALKRKDLVQKKYIETFHQYDLLCATAIEMRLLFNIYRNDPYARRFFTEFFRLSDKNKTDIEYTHQLEFLDRLCIEINIPIEKSQDELSIITYSMMGSVNQFLSAYFDGNIDCTPEYACNYYIRMFFKALKAEDEKINEIQVNSLNQYQKLDFQIMPKFKIK